MHLRSARTGGAVRSSWRCRRRRSSATTCPRSATSTRRWARPTPTTCPTTASSSPRWCSRWDRDHNNGTKRIRLMLANILSERWSLQSDKDQARQRWSTSAYQGCGIVGNVHRGPRSNLFVNFERFHIIWVSCNSWKKRDTIILS